MIISHKHRFVFVHIPKTAGTSIMAAMRPKLCKAKDVISDNGPTKHLTVREIRQQFFHGLAWRKYFTFAVMRNPWERLHSDWWHCKWQSQNVGDQQGTWWDKVRRAANQTFDEFCGHEYNLNEPHSVWGNYCLSQTSEELVRFTMRYEMLADDWRWAVRLLGLPGLKLGRENNYDRPDYRLDYTDDLAEQVAKCYADDIRRFGYRFDGV